MSYEKTTWENGDIITAEKLNNLETGVANSDGVIFEFETYKNGSYDIGWKSVDDASEIIEAFLAAKRVLFHLPADLAEGYALQDLYIPPLGYRPRLVIPPDPPSEEVVYAEEILMPEDLIGDYDHASVRPTINGTHIGEDGKLYLKLYID